MKPEKFLLAGFGGQGILLMGTLLARTGMDEGKHVTWFPSYGPAMRGGTAHCSVIISKNEIASPIISFPDVLVAMNRASLDRFEPDIRKKGILFYNSSLVTVPPRRKDLTCYPVAATELAGNLTSMKVANMVMLGAIIKAAGVIGIKQTKRALSQTLPGSKHHLLELNYEALEKGYSLF